MPEDTFSHSAAQLVSTICFSNNTCFHLWLREETNRIFYKIAIQSGAFKTNGKWITRETFCGIYECSPKYLKNTSKRAWAQHFLQDFMCAKRRQLAHYWLPIECSAKTLSHRRLAWAVAWRTCSLIGNAMPRLKCFSGNTLWGWFVT